MSREVASSEFRLQLGVGGSSTRCGSSDWEGVPSSSPHPGRGGMGSTVEPGCNRCGRILKKGSRSGLGRELVGRKVLLRVLPTQSLRRPSSDFYAWFLVSRTPTP